MADIDDARKAFEEWARDEEDLSLACGLNGEYMLASTDAAWKGRHRERRWFCVNYHSKHSVSS